MPITAVFKKPHFLLFFLLFIAALFPIQAQQITDTEEDTLYTIAGFEFDIKGRTRPFVLINAAELKTGEQIRGAENLDLYIREKTQILINQRVLKDNVVITWREQESPAGEQDASCNIILYINVEDSWNYIFFPYPRYSTSEGFDITINARDMNFLGTMEPLIVNFGYTLNENRRSSFQLDIIPNAPFSAFGFTWNFKFEHNFHYRVEAEEPFFYKNVTGLSIDLPLRRVTFTPGFDEYFLLNEWNPERYRDSYGDFQNGFYMVSKPFVNVEIPLGLNVSRFGELTYSPGVWAKFHHEMPGMSLHAFNKGPFLGFDHSLGFEKIDWHDNFRKGLSVFIENFNDYDFYRYSKNEYPLNIELAVRGIGHFMPAQFFGISTRLQYRHWLYREISYQVNAGEVLRGIADWAVDADYMLSLNLDFPFRVFRPSPAEDRQRKGTFDLEFHLSPIMDLALYNDPVNNISFDIKNIAFCAGAELLVFPLFIRNIYLRISAAWNISELISPGKFQPDSGFEFSASLWHLY
ncbi:MAG: hypothetical protein FWG99_09215 [Treponema sp.]|nr:hypothetical protein [Treponema sp.]